MAGCQCTVPNSVMPKGVEHLQQIDLHHMTGRVPNSVMPKGVEHVYLPGQKPLGVLGAEFSDAERR